MMTTASNDNRTDPFPSQHQSTDLKDCGWNETVSLISPSVDLLTENPTSPRKDQSRRLTASTSEFNWEVIAKLAARCL